MKKKMRTVLSVLLAALLLVSIVPAFTLPAKAADVWNGTWDGSGFSNNHITSAKGLAQFINNCGTGTSYSGQTVYLDVDIDLNNIDFGNIDGGKNVYYSRDNYFQGTFDGQGHTIYNFRMHNSDHRIGLFRSAKNATFKNVNFENVFIDDNNDNGKNGFAVMVGFGDGNITFENVHVKSGEVYGYNYVGGLIGEYGANNILTFTNCSNSALIYADNDRAAGLVGHSKGRVYATNCSNSGEIYAAYSDAGGLAGWIEDDESYFVNCSNTGNVSTDSAAGGMVGYFGSKSNDNKMTITGCSNTGNITSRKSSSGGCAGGMAGKLDTDATHEFANNVNRGTITATGESAGGIVGSNMGGGTWNNCRNYGNIYGNGDNGGGILGEIEDDVQTFYNCLNAGDISSKNTGGGIMGWGSDSSAPSFERCFNYGKVSAGSYGGGILGGHNGGSSSNHNSFSECMNVGNVESSDNGGGIVGEGNWTYITRCFNMGNISRKGGGTSKAYGGLIGWDVNDITDSYNVGNVTYGDCTGGILGGDTHGSYNNCYNAGSCTGGNKNRQIKAQDSSGSFTNCWSCSSVSGETQWNVTDSNGLRDLQGTLNSNAYCKDTWGVNNGYPILKWWRDNYFKFPVQLIDGSTTVLNDTYAYNAVFTAPKRSKTGYTFNGWFTASAGGSHVWGPDDTQINAGVTAPMNTCGMTVNTGDNRPNVLPSTNPLIYYAQYTKNQYYLDVNGYLDGDSTAGGTTGYGTFDMYINGNLVADDVDDFWQQIYYEDTYEIRDIKPASGKAYVGLTEGSLSGTMGTEQINIRLQFKTQYTVTFKDGNGATVDAQTVLYGGNAAAPDMTEYLQKTDDAQIHYHFLGTWDTAFTNVTSNLTVNGNYETQQHSYGDYTSMNAANHIRTCAACGYVENTVHHFTAATVNGNTLKTPATCTNAAVYYYSCAECGEIERNDSHIFTSGNANGHQYGEWIEGQAATCSAEGHVGYYECGVCHKYFDAEKNELATIVLNIDPDAHSYGNWTKLNDEKHQRVCAYDPDHVETADHSWQQTGSVT
ncbi:MAG: InlB B-repeat-containing protein, partial [Clostridia bacterium]|nr:InlB B-repeat-containing protein [Clostridia bacterium]